MPIFSECNTVPRSQGKSILSVDEQHSDESEELRETEQVFQLS